MRSARSARLTRDSQLVFGTVIYGAAVKKCGRNKSLQVSATDDDDVPWKSTGARRMASEIRARPSISEATARRGVALHICFICAHFYVVQSHFHEHGERNGVCAIAPICIVFTTQYFCAHSQPVSEIRNVFIFQQNCCGSFKQKAAPCSLNVPEGPSHYSSKSPNSKNTYVKHLSIKHTTSWQQEKWNM